MLCHFTYKDGDKEKTIYGRAAIEGRYKEVMAANGPKGFDDLRLLLSFMWLLEPEEKIQVHKWNAALLSKAASSSSKRKGQLAVGSSSSTASATAGKAAKKAANQAASLDDLAALFG